MPKIKTHSGAKKRFKTTKSGKVKRAHAYTHTFLLRSQQSVREIFARQQLLTLQTKSNARDLFLINKKNFA